MPVCLPTLDYKGGASVLVSGWGRMKEGRIWLHMIQNTIIYIAYIDISYVDDFAKYIVFQQAVPCHVSSSI